MNGHIRVFYILFWFAYIFVWFLVLTHGVKAADLIHQVSARHGVPPQIVRAVVKVESGGRCNARNAGAVGIMQVLPRTARSVGVNGNLTDCTTGLEAGVRYLKIALQRGGHGCAGVSLYQRGVHARPVCTAYGMKVMRIANAQ